MEEEEEIKEEPVSEKSSPLPEPQRYVTADRKEEDSILRLEIDRLRSEINSLKQRTEKTTITRTLFDTGFYPPNVVATVVVISFVLGAIIY